ncbi:hypothetical protein BCR33DRAFT_846219 [Rhizoclosmatium globosum]|uniref:Uncharacterized protein n=1 Tax=Rhizoclosmatium globosum TaxID=329046 RepID=A0A1Y2CWZ9_9FUNG|nr:hypothetical protein BCR33DRAFT_846219 [Rhizoclosmatium globosum]|eukprot:ORY51416.1 hypothetical protein BCR33DRAFT_846219 [Rhizoclosmatium globosum]
MSTPCCATLTKKEEALLGYTWFNVAASSSTSTSSTNPSQLIVVFSAGVAMQSSVSGSCTGTFGQTTTFVCDGSNGSGSAGFPVALASTAALGDKANPLSISLNGEVCTVKDSCVQAPLPSSTASAPSLPQQTSTSAVTLPPLSSSTIAEVRTADPSRIQPPNPLSSTTTSVGISANNSNDNGSSSGPSIGPIAGVTVAVIVLVVLLVFLLLRYRKRKRQQDNPDFTPVLPGGNFLVSSRNQNAKPLESVAVSPLQNESSATSFGSNQHLLPQTGGSNRDSFANSVLSKFGASTGSASASVLASHPEASELETHKPTAVGSPLPQEMQFASLIRKRTITDVAVVPREVDATEYPPHNEVVDLGYLSMERVRRSLERRALLEHEQQKLASAEPESVTASLLGLEPEKSPNAHAAHMHPNVVTSVAALAEDAPRFRSLDRKTHRVASSSNPPQPTPTTGVSPEETLKRRNTHSKASPTQNVNNATSSPAAPHHRIIPTKPLLDFSTESVSSSNPSSSSSKPITKKSIPPIVPISSTTTTTTSHPPKQSILDRFSSPPLSPLVAIPQKPASPLVVQLNIDDRVDPSSASSPTRSYLHHHHHTPAVPMSSPLVPQVQQQQQQQQQHLPLHTEVRTVPQTSNEAIEFALMQLRMKVDAERRAGGKQKGIEESETEGGSESDSEESG